MTCPPEEWEWIQRIRHGDAAAFETLVREHGPRLVQFAAGFLGAHDDAEDVVQEVLWHIWDGRGSWRPTVSLRAYLLTAVRNRALNVLAHRRVRADHRAAIVAAGPQGNSEASPAEAVVVAEEEAARRRVLERAFATLTEKQRTAVRLRFSEGLVMAEVAAALKVSVSASERLIARALRALRVEAERAGRA